MFNKSFMSSLDITHPELAKQWHPTLNGSFKPSDVSKGSHKVVWWYCSNKCQEGCIHEWESAVSNRAGREDGCPFCSTSPKRICVHNSIAFKNPEVASQWYQQLNGDLRPENVSPGSNKIVFWRCNKTCVNGCEHIWKTSVTNRCSGTNCPFCSGLKHCIHESILYTHPELVKQWNYEKNKELKPSDVKEGSEKKVHWVCEKGHETQTSVYLRAKKNSGCQKCSRKGPNVIIDEADSIINTHPDIAKQFHPTKNQGVDLKNLCQGSGKLITWFCENKCVHGCPHEWKTSVNNRTGLGRGCPFCSKPPKKICIHSSIVFTHPHIAAQWHPTKNGEKKPEHYSHGSEVNVSWKCENTCKEGCIHEWESNINNRTGKRSDGCPFCGDFKKKHCIHMSVLHTHPELVKQWHPTKNGDLKPEDFTKGSTQNIHWICSNKCRYGCLHEWEATINTRTSGHGCAFCVKLKTCLHDSIIYTNPEVFAEWDYELNKDLDPQKLGRASHLIVYWKCKKTASHSWQTKIRNRCLDLTGCVWCVNKTESKLYDYLIKLYPSLKKQLKLESCKNKTYLPFDFCIPELKVIIELDGSQHFKQVSNWQSPEKTIKRDIYKMQKAIKEGYKIIRIFQEDVYKYDETWLEKTLMPEIQNMDRSPVFISSEIESLYDEHIKLYEANEEIELEISDTDSTESN